MNRNTKKKNGVAYTTYGIVVIFIFFAIWSISSLPSNFPVGTNFVVDEGESLQSISARLETEHYINSALFFRMWVSFLGRDRHVQLGLYSFDEPLTLGSVVKRLIYGNPDAPLLSITVPEGSTTGETAEIIKKVLPDFSIDVFNKKVSEKDANGKLFPSTYYLLPSYDEEKIVSMMMDTFNRKYEAYFAKSKIPTQLKNQQEVIILASLLEGEAKTEEDMKLVSGILLKRLSINMALQVDVAKETYKSRGLPNEPINNPGIIALDATFNPTSSSYLYYLTDKTGIMHYSKTFEEHKRNIQKYLK